jgi:predicted nucleotidyltransferase component of viral defense system
MIPQAYINEWRIVSPWPTDAQIEQDLILSRALIEIFLDPFLAKSLAFRGGTALHKLFIQPSGRYSEDIDLVQINEGPIANYGNSAQSIKLAWAAKMEIKGRSCNFHL